jgi:OmcA/MtrC family decaheme c-type cytochrome
VTKGIVWLEGKPQLPLPAGFDNPEYTFPAMYVRAKTPTREFIVGTGALPAVARRQIVDTGQCLKCHVGSLYQHGNTRVDNVDMCVLCHNSASSDQNNRVAMGVDKSEAYDGLVGQTYEMKTMLHRIHTAGALDEDDNPLQPPLVIYRTRGIYAWAVDESMLPNWPGTSPSGTEKFPVFGANPDAANDIDMQPHNFYSPTYPRPFNDCYACHAESFDVIPDQSMAVATTLDAGTAPWQNKIDDTLQGATAAACTSCHTSTDAKGHAYNEGWTPQKFENGRQTILDTK